MGGGRRADDIRDFGRPVSDWMIDQLGLEPGQRILELAAGPGDTGFLAAQRISPGGTLICSDASEAMLDIARERARELGVDNVEFRQLQLEWIDLETASVDAALCRWGLMLLVDPAAAAQEIRRVLRPGGRFATAVWATADDNPWATIPTRALIELGHAQPPDREAPGMFRLGDSGRLGQLLESAGFVEVRLDTLDIGRTRPSLDAYLAEQLDLSLGFAETRQRLDDASSGRRFSAGSPSSRSPSPPRTARSASRPAACWRRPALSCRCGALRPRGAKHVLRRRRRPEPPRRQDRGHTRLRVPGARPRAEPQGLRRRRSSWGCAQTRPSAAKAAEHGLRVLDTAEAAAEGDVVMMLVPDERHREVWESGVSEGVEAGNLVMFGHGFSIHYHEVEPPPDVDVALVAPKGPGHLVRRQFLEGSGVPGLVAVHQNPSGSALEVALAYAKGIGCTRGGVIETTFKDETETDLFGEQAVLCGGVTELVRAGYETLVDAGYDPRLAYFECLHELKLIVDLMYEKGIAGMRYSVSNTAEYGDLTRGSRVIGRSHGRR